MSAQAARPAAGPEPSIRVADHVELAIRHVEELQRQIAAEKERMLALVQAAELPDEEIAEIYWRFEAVPVSALGQVQDVVAVAQAYPYWSWRCQRCGGEVFCTSRTEKAERERKARGKKWVGPLYWMCDGCRGQADAERTAAHQAAASAYRQRERQLRTMPYKQYLRTPEWQERRKASLKRAAYACQVCNRNRVLHVHHRTYERRGAELARDLIVLCDECHALYHGKGLLAPHEPDED